MTLESSQTLEVGVGLPTYRIENAFIPGDRPGDSIMARRQPDHIIVIGAGAAGLMAARELGRAGKKVTVLEARGRCGGRIDPLPVAEFGYPAEGGAEFVHGEAPVTRNLLREAGLSLLPVRGARWKVARGAFSRNELPEPDAGHFYECLARLKADITVADFLRQHFAGPEHDRLREFVVRMVEGYDAADPARASMLALRDEWTNSERSMQARVVGGYGALIDALVADCDRQAVTIHCHAAVGAIETTAGPAVVHCANGEAHVGDAVILTVPLPVLDEIVLPPAYREKMAAAADIGFGNVIKLVLRFKSHWWTAGRGKELSDLLFLRSDETIPVWWTQHPAEHPVLTGWFAGPRTKGMAHLDEEKLVEAGIASLANMFASVPEHLKRDMIAARAINWANDVFARGAYSYATPETRKARARLANPEGGVVLFSGEALYRGQDMGTVEAALASGLEAARTVMAPDYFAMS
jgi:monoamine oxidase